MFRYKNSGFYNFGLKNALILEGEGIENEKEIYRFYMEKFCSWRIIE